MMNPRFLLLPLLFCSLLSVAQVDISNYIDKDLFEMKNVSYDLQEYNKRFKELNPDDLEGYFNRGILKLEKGLLDEAIIDMDYVIELYPEMAGAFFIRGICYRMIDSINLAATDLYKAIELDPTMADAFNEAGALELSRSDAEKAKKLFKQSIKIEPSNPLPVLNMGIISLYHDFRISKANSYFKAALKLDNRLAPAYFHMGAIKFFQQNIIGTKKLLNKAIATDPSFVEAHLWKMLINLLQYNIKEGLVDIDNLIAIQPNNPFFYSIKGFVYIEIKEYDKAIDLLIKSTKMAPLSRGDYDVGKTALGKQTDMQYALLYHSKNLFKMSQEQISEINHGLGMFINEKYFAAHDHFVKAIKMDMDEPVPYYMAGLAKEYLKEFPDAVKYYDQTLALDNNIPEAYKKRGLIKQEQGLMNDAISDFNFMVNLDTSLAISYKVRGIAYMSVGMLRSAKMDFSKYLEEKPADTDILFNRATCNKGLGEYQQAIEDLTSVVTNKPTDFEAFYLRAECKYLLNDKTGAFADCDSSLAKYSGYASAYNLKGVILNERKDFQTALFYYNKALQYEKKNHLFYVNRGKNFLDTNRYQEAISDFDQAIRLQINDGYAFYYRGMAKIKLGQKEEGMQDLESAQVLGIILPDDFEEI